MIKYIIILLAAHYFADFWLQPEKWALSKWHDSLSLFKHVLTYTIGFFLVTWLFFGTKYIGWLYWAALFNGFWHFWIDFVTSKLTHYYHAKKNMNMFWKIIGLDQFLHYAVLAVIYGYVYTIMY